MNSDNAQINATVIALRQEFDLAFAQAPRKQSTPMLTASVARSTPLNTQTTAHTLHEEKSFGEASGNRLSQLLAEEASKNKGMIKPKVEVIGEVCESCSA